MIGLLGLLCLLLVGGVVGGDYILHKQATKLTNLKLDNRLIDEQQKALVQANKDIQKYSDLEKIANAIVPQDKDQARTVREITKLASDNNVPITNITFDASTLGQAAPVAPKSTDNSGTTQTPVVTTPSVSQAKPVDGLPGILQMNIAVSDANKDTNYYNFLRFLNALEQNRRTAQETQISIQPDQKNPNNFSFSFNINVFIKPWNLI